MLECKIFNIKNLNKIEQKLNNWFLLNKEKKVVFITQSYVLVDESPIDKEGRSEKPGVLFIFILSSLKRIN